MIDLEESVLTVDEFEAVRLKDLDGLEQEEAAKNMNISQPTFHRLILSARKKIADAIVNGKAIKIHGGMYKMTQQVQSGRGRGGPGRGHAVGWAGPATECVCPKCNHKEPKERGDPCITKKCPKCGTLMVRGR